jgi:protocatechuate 3,4-dioxygenase beta subunit
VTIPPDGQKDDLAIRLVPDDVPIIGRIIDLEGKPVRGASLQVLQINAASDEDLNRWLEAAKGRKGESFELEHEYLPQETIAPSPTITTDAEGRFRLTGIGRNRLVLAQLDCPSIVSEYLHILTRPGEPIEVPYRIGRPDRGEPRIVTTYYGAVFQHAAAPCKPIVGVVRDKDTKKPLAGVTVRSYMLATRPNSIAEIVRTTTDAEGRFRLTGMPKGKGNKIMAVPGSEQPYPVCAVDAPDTPGLDPVSVDVELRRGVWIEGKITDKVTGKPLKASVEYFALYSNPNLRDYPGFDGAIRPFEGVRAKDDGSYRVVGLPGPGLVSVLHWDHYLRAPDRDDEEGVNEISLSTAPYHMSFTSNYDALARIDPAKGTDSVKWDVTLDPGWTFTGTVLGPDGQPLAGAWGMEVGLMKTADFTVRGFNPRRPRELLFKHSKKGFVGVARTPKDNGGSIIVPLQPGAMVTGRLVDADRRPRADVELIVYIRPKYGAGRPVWDRYSYPACERIKTDRDGRFRIDALLPGYEFRISDGVGDRLVGDGLRSGQTKDLGDVRLTGEEP